MINDKEKRLTISQIKAHPFFNGVNWKNLRKMKPPFIPKLSNEVDVRNFDAFEIQEPWNEEERVIARHEKKKSCSLECHFKFAGFNFKKIEEDPLEEIKKSLDQTLEKHKKYNKEFTRDKKRLKTEQSSQREDRTLKNTLSFVKSFQKENSMLRTTKKLIVMKKQKKNRSIKSKKKEKTLKINRVGVH